MNCPPFLQNGDKVAIVAPARKVSRSELEPAFDFIERNGWKAVFSEELTAEFHQWSGNDLHRCKDLQNYLNDPEIRMIWCARGGYGSMRIVDLFDWSAFQRFPKWLVGFSDITVLLQDLVHQRNCCAIHGPVALTINKGEQTANSLASVLKGNYPAIQFPPDAKNRKGSATGMLHGGNLSLLYALQSSKQDVFPKGSILFIEDLDEYLYHLDRMMVSLRRSGKLKNLGALVVGGMTSMRDNEIPFGFSPEEIILDAVRDYNFPVCFNFPAGHIDNNHALIFGREVEVFISENSCKLRYC